MAVNFSNINNIAIMLKGHIDLIYFPISTKIPQTATATSHIITKYVPETNMPLKCYICQLVHVQVSNNYDSIYTSYQLITIK